MKITGLKIFAAIVTVFVVAVIVTAFVVVGSPSQERARRMDTQRSSDLQQLSWAVNNYYNQMKSLPASIDDLRKSPDVYVQSVVDPQTGKMYEYRITGERSYEVCATFETEQTGNNPNYAQPVMKGLPDLYFTHGIGRNCVPQTVAPLVKGVPVQ
ncbi:MAG: hypothetical protein WC551_03185 [Patescibacteria group bacterium]